MIKNKPEAYGISSDNLLCMVQELETFVEDIHSISVVCDNDVIFSKCIQQIGTVTISIIHQNEKKAMQYYQFSNNIDCFFMQNLHIIH